MNPKKVSWKIIFAVIFVDQFCKFLAANFFPSIIIKNYHFPFGITFPFGSPATREFFYFTIVTVALIIFSIIISKMQATHLVENSLIIGGALSNLLDRIALGYVRDFLNIGITAFNLADAAVWVGIGMLLWNIKTSSKAI